MEDTDKQKTRQMSEDGKDKKKKKKQHRLALCLAV